MASDTVEVIMEVHGCKNYLKQDLNPHEKWSSEWYEWLEVSDVCYDECYCDSPLKISAYNGVDLEEFIESLRDYVQWLTDEYNLSNVKLKGYHEFEIKATRPPTPEELDRKKKAAAAARKRKETIAAKEKAAQVGHRK
jgi:hypothetical protein